jgi:hypothetical protein
MERKETNMEIIESLKEYFNLPENEGIRFFQGLSNLGLFNQQFDDRLNCTGIDDPYYYESEKILNKIKSKIEK